MAYFIEAFATWSAKKKCMSYFIYLILFYKKFHFIPIDSNRNHWESKLDWVFAHFASDFGQHKNVILTIKIQELSFFFKKKKKSINFWIVNSEWNHASVEVVIERMEFEFCTNLANITTTISATTYQEWPSTKNVPEASCQ